MIITCKLAFCPYHDSQNFCAKPNVLGIDENGMCSVVWRKGKPNQVFNSNADLRDKIIITDVAAVEVNNVIKEENKEETESRLEDPKNEASASKNEQKIEEKTNEKNS